MEEMIFNTRAEINFMHLLANAYYQEPSKQTFAHLLLLCDNKDSNEKGSWGFAF